MLGFQVNGWGVAVDCPGNIVDSANGAVLFLNEQSSSVSRYGKTLASKQATVIAGTATGTGAGTCGDGNKNVPATGGTSANLQFPHPIVDASGNVYVNDNRGAADTGCTWVLPAATGTLDGQTMTAGDLYSLTGAATTTAATNGAVANTAGLPNPSGVALDPAGNVVVSLAGCHPSPGGDRRVHRHLLRPVHDQGPRLPHLGRGQRHQDDHPGERHRLQVLRDRGGGHRGHAALRDHLVGDWCPR